MNDLFSKIDALVVQKEFSKAAELLSGFSANQLSKRFNQDLEKIEAFHKAILNKILETALRLSDLIAKGEVEQAKALVLSLTLLISEYSEVLKNYLANAESIGKFQFPKDIWSGKYKDPWKASREAARKFNLKWGLGLNI